MLFNFKYFFVRIFVFRNLKKTWHGVVSVKGKCYKGWHYRQSTFKYKIKMLIFNFSVGKSAVIFPIEKPFGSFANICLSCGFVRRTGCQSEQWITGHSVCVLNIYQYFIQTRCLKRNIHVNILKKNILRFHCIPFLGWHFCLFLKGWIRYY